jgi:hypothetical protein
MTTTKHGRETTRRGQFTSSSPKWRLCGNRGLIPLQEGLPRVPAGKGKAAALDLAIAETCHHHFQSVANQVEFYVLRDKLAQAGASGRAQILKRMRALAALEIELARRLFLLARRNSTIGFEASNHYYYTPLDLVEKVLNCRDIIARMA